MDHYGDVKFSTMVRLILSIMALGLSSSNFCQADTPTPEELCRQRNSASCEINGLKFFIEDDCPRGAKILRPKGKERCDNLTNTINADGKVLTEAQLKPVSQAIEAVPAMPKKTAEAGIFENAFFVVAVVGLLQGLISRASWGPFIIVAVVMPSIATWTMVSAASPRVVGAEYWGYIGFEFLQLLVYSMLGWGAGLAVHNGLLRLMFK